MLCKSTLIERKKKKLWPFLPGVNGTGVRDQFSPGAKRSQARSGSIKEMGFCGVEGKSLEKARVSE